MTKFRPSTFAGLDLVATPPPSWPFAWVYAADRKKVVARTDAAKKAPKGTTFAHRTVVPVLEERDGFVRVADGQWIDRSSLRIARTRPRPAIADAHAKWIDLDRDEQVLIAYDGDTPVFATLFCSGVAHHSPIVDLDLAGNFVIKGKLSAVPPSPCLSPVLLIRNAGGTQAWFAAGIPGGDD